MIYVAGSVASLGSDARIEELTKSDVTLVGELCTQAGFDHIVPGNVTRVASAKQLYNFDAVKAHSY